MRSIGISLLFVCALLACSDDRPQLEEATREPESSEAVARDFDARMLDIARIYLALRPETATYYGIDDDVAGEGASARLSDYSVQGELDRRAGLESIIDELNGVDAAALTDSQRISLELVKYEAEAALAPATAVEYGFVLGSWGFWFDPYIVSHLTGPHVEVPDRLENQMAVRTRADAAAYLQRLALYAGALDDANAKMRADMALGAIPPDFSIDRTITNLTLDVGVPAREHSLVTSFANKLSEARIDDPALVEQAATILGEQVYPAIGRLIEALAEAREHAVHDAGIDRLPNGAALYQAMITHMTDTTLTADEIHSIGLGEVERIHAEMDVLLRQIGHAEGTVGERMSVMLADPQYIYPDTEEGKAQLLANLEADLALADAELPKWFGKLPDQKVAIRAVPPHKEGSRSGAWYDAPSQDGTRPGTFWISLADTAASPSYSLQTLTYHETNPGHHLQVVLSLDDSLPLLNSLFFCNAAGEGWALYAERLASEMGLYEGDPVDDLGRLQSELHRAVRLVVDTGMHGKGWSREQAIDYSVATEGIHRDEATNEIERYAVWPAQALGYKLGELRILELRERARDRLGERFDIREFHDRVLEDGALPSSLLEAKIDAWLAQEAAEPD